MIEILLKIFPNLKTNISTELNSNTGTSMLQQILKSI